MAWSEASIARAIATQTLARRCVVLVDNCNWTGHECDVLAVTTDLRIIDIEVKISRADLKADAKKEKWWHRANNFYFGHHVHPSYVRHGPPEPDQPRTWPPKVWKHYYALPSDIWKPELLECLPSPASGVLLLRDITGARTINAPVVVTCARRATPNKAAERLSPENVMDIARLTNIRMWENHHRMHSAAATKEPQH